MTNAVLFSLHLSRHIDGFGKPSVKSVLNEKYLEPNKEDIKHCLPYYYKKAFDRKNTLIRYTDGSYSISLYTTKGKYMNTVYAIPYEFKA